jgi:hypothetical protein
MRPGSPFFVAKCDRLAPEADVAWQFEAQRLGDAAALKAQHRDDRPGMRRVAGMIQSWYVS